MLRCLLRAIRVDGYNSRIGKALLWLAELRIARREFSLATVALEMALERLMRTPPGPGRTKDRRKAEELLAEAAAGLPR